MLDDIMPGNRLKCFCDWSRECVCPRYDSCLVATLGTMVEQGLIKERFDKKRDEHIYTITQKGIERLMENGLLPKPPKRFF